LLSVPSHIRQVIIPTHDVLVEMARTMSFQTGKYQHVRTIDERKRGYRTSEHSDPRYVNRICISSAKSLISMIEEPISQASADSLHQRLISGDVTAPAEVAETFLPFVLALAH